MGLMVEFVRTLALPLGVTVGRAVEDDGGNGVEKGVCPGGVRSVRRSLVERTVTSRLLLRAAYTLTLSVTAYEYTYLHYYSICMR